MPPPNNCETPPLLTFRRVARLLRCLSSHGRQRLLAGCCVLRFDGGHLRPWPLPVDYNSTTKPATRRPPTHSARAVRPSRLTLRFPCQISIDCCVLICKMAATLRRCHLPSPIYFLTPLISPLQVSEPTTVYAIPTACGLSMALGISSAMI